MMDSMITEKGITFKELEENVEQRPVTDDSYLLSVSDGIFALNPDLRREPILLRPLPLLHFHRRGV